MGACLPKIPKIAINMSYDYLFIYLFILGSHGKEMWSMWAQDKYLQRER